jgi:hypothetical protein
VNSFSALVLSLLAGHFMFAIPWNFTWLLSVAFFEAILVVVAVCAWQDTMRMLSFMTSLEARNIKDEPAPSGETSASA